MKKYLALVLFGFCLLGGCGGGALGSGSPEVSFSTNILTFGTEVIGMTSQPLPVTLSNVGTATLSIASIAASVNFGETNTCGPTLAAGANCTIGVTFTPTASGGLNGTVSVTDNAVDSPQMVSLSGGGSSTGPSCSAKGQNCAPQLPPCCSGLVCTFEGDRDFCEPP